MSSRIKPFDSKSSSKSSNPSACLVSHVGAQLQAGSFVSIIHVGNSDYLRFLHDLIASLLLKKRRVHVFDYHRRIKIVYLQQVIQQQGGSLASCKRLLDFKVILDEEHALDALFRLERQNLSQRYPHVLFLIDPSGLFGRLRGGVKKSASSIQFQYEVAGLFAQRGFAVVVSDSGGREFHRVDALVPRLLAEPATLIMQYLPRRLVLA